MNVVVGSNEVGGIKTVECLSRIVWQWLFSQPALGEPSVHHSIGHALHRHAFSWPLCALIVRRAQLYFEAGHPVETCETSASRDLWAVMVCAGERGNSILGAYRNKGISSKSCSSKVL